MNNHSPYRHVDSIHPGETAIHRNTERQIFFLSVSVEYECAYLRASVCREAYRGGKGAFTGSGRKMSRWWAFVKVMVMDLGDLSSTPTVISLLVLY